MRRPSTAGVKSPRLFEVSLPHASLQIVTVGLNHRSANLDVRERLAFAGGDLPDALARLREIVDEGFILSTCNRVEVYGLTGHAESGAGALRRFLVEGRSLSVEAVEKFTYAYAHEDAVRHLFRVAGGVDSMVLGENEILGQLRRALQTAHEHAILGSTLSRLGAAAIRAGRLTRAETGLGTGSVSLVSLGLRAAIQIGVSIETSNVVVLGGGDISRMVIRQLKRARARNIALVNRTSGRAARLAEEQGVGAADWDDRVFLVSQADLLITCTSAPHPVLRASDIAPRTDRPLVCIDLGVPRDIDAAARGLPGVTIVDVDELESLAAENRLRYLADADRAEAMLAAHAEKFMEWWRARQVVPTITDLRAYGETIRDAEMRRVLGRLSGLSPQQITIIESLAQRIVGKLLHRPLTMLKHDAEGGNMAHVLRYLFQLDGAPPPGIGPVGTSKHCAHERPERNENEEIETLTGAQPSRS